MGKSLEQYLNEANKQVPDRDIRAPLEATWSNWWKGIKQAAVNTKSCIKNNPQWLLQLPYLIANQVRICVFMTEAIDSRVLEWGAGYTQDLSGSRVMYPEELVYYRKTINGQVYNIPERMFDLQCALNVYNHDPKRNKRTTSRKLCYGIESPYHPELLDSVHYFADEEYYWGEEYAEAIAVLQAYFDLMAKQIGRDTFLVEPWTMGAAICIFSPHPEGLEGAWTEEPSLIIPNEMFMNDCIEDVDAFLDEAWAALLKRDNLHRQAFLDQKEANKERL